MIKTTKEQILAKFPLDSVCKVWYRNSSGVHQCHGVLYKEGLKHVKWKSVWRIKIFFKKEKIYRNKYGDVLRRDGVVYFLE